MVKDTVNSQCLFYLWGEKDMIFEEEEEWEETKDEEGEEEW